MKLVFLCAVEFLSSFTKFNVDSTKVSVSPMSCRHVSMSEAASESELTGGERMGEV